MAKAFVAIIGDAASYLRAVRQSISASGQLGVAFKDLSIDAKASAQAQIDAAVKRDAALRSNVVALRQAAAQQPAGSREQVVATNLANAAQLRLARSYGVTGKEAEHLSRSVGHAERDIGKATRGALAGSGVFQGLGRSLAFASGGYLAFAGGFDILKKSVDAARQLAVTQRQDATQLHAAGESWKAYRGEIEKTTLALSDKSGFTNQALLQSFGLLARSTGDATQALRLNAVAADVARGRGISLNAAAVALGKAWNGDTASLKRLGVEVPKGVSGLAAINAVAAKFQGQARAGASAADRFNTILTNSEEIIGQALLPVLNRYLGEFGNWLAKMNESGRLQQDVNTVVHDAAGAFRAAADVAKVFLTVIRGVDHVTGGFKQTLETLIGLAFVTKLGRWTGALKILTGAKGAGGLLGAESAAGSLLGKLKALAGLGIIAVEVELFEYFIRKYGLANTIRAGLNPTQTLGPGISKDQTITVKGKTYQIGSSAAYEALVKAGAKLPPIGKVTAAEEIRAAKKLGGSASIPAPKPTPRDTAAERRRREEEQRQHREAARRAAQAAAAARQLGTTTSNPQLQKIALEVARAAATGNEKRIVAVARSVIGQLQALIPHLTPKDQKTAYALEARERKVVAEAQKKQTEAATKAAKQQEEAAKKQAEAAKRLGDAAQKAADAADKQIGALFQGPILAPTHDQILAQLGAYGPPAKTLVADLKAQTRQYVQFERNLKILQKRGAPPELIRELQKLGVSASLQVQTLARAPRAVLEAYFKAFKQRERVAMHAAVVNLNTPKVSLQAQQVIMGSGGSRQAARAARAASRVPVPRRPPPERRPAAARRDLASTRTPAPARRAPVPTARPAVASARKQMRAEIVSLNTPRATLHAQRALIASPVSASVTLKDDRPIKLDLYVDGRKLEATLRPHRQRADQHHISLRGGRYSAN